MRKATIAIACAGLVLAACAASEAASRRPEPRQAQMKGAFEKADANGDGGLSKAEFERYQAAEKAARAAAVKPEAKKTARPTAKAAQARKAGKLDARDKSQRERRAKAAKARKAAAAKAGPRGVEPKAVRERGRQEGRGKGPQAMRERGKRQPRAMRRDKARREAMKRMLRRRMTRGALRRLPRPEAIDRGRQQGAQAMPGIRRPQPREDMRRGAPRDSGESGDRRRFERPTGGRSSAGPGGQGPESQGAQRSQARGDRDAQRRGRGASDREVMEDWQLLEDMGIVPR